MYKRMLLILALGAALAACSPAGGTSSPSSSLAPIDSPAASDAVPSQSLDAASPSAS